MSRFSVNIWETISHSRMTLSESVRTLNDNLMTTQLGEDDLLKFIDQLSLENPRTGKSLLQYACLLCDVGDFGACRDALGQLLNNEQQSNRHLLPEITYYLAIYLNSYRKNLPFIVGLIAEHDKSTAAAISFSIVSRNYDKDNLDFYYAIILEIAETHLSEGRFFQAFDVIEPLVGLGMSQYLHSWIYRGVLIEARIRFQLGLKADSERLVKEFQKNSTGHVSDFGPILRLGSVGCEAKSSVMNPQDSGGWTDLMDRIDFSRISQHYDPRPRVLQLKAARIISGSPGNSFFQFPVSSDNEIYIDEFNIHPRYFVGLKDSPVLSVDKDLDVLVNFFGHKHSKEIVGNSLLLGGAPNYYHWLFEYLPRLASCESLESYDQIVVNPHFREWQTDFLRIIDPSCVGRLLPLDHINLLKFERLDCPTLPQINIAVGFLCRTFLPDEIKVPWRRVFISRRDAGPERIRIEDEDEFYSDVLRPRGFELVVLNGLAVCEQIKIFSEASIVVGAHGAGLSNIVFCSDQANVIEINNSTNCRYAFFSEVSKIKRQKFVRYIGEDIVRAGTHPEDFSVRIKYSDFVRRFDSLLEN